VVRILKLDPDPSRRFRIRESFTIGDPDVIPSQMVSRWTKTKNKTKNNEQVKNIKFFLVLIIVLVIIVIQLLILFLFVIMFRIPIIVNQ
jgi:uncharacterized membrane protein